ncbi:inositol hexakisphosphate-domain-containing protein [Leucosporidium creatinivorum]|uniref:Inositol hexakisphosphate-domain-containing protein n=1 Tax=Leucosporidium creatinivorum TaxID=106004 RepID=A0A1Y2FL36_9BASI|nr:inositol hexakisphosphate-domain-containing protein [Leucosporidium creatinivorum]
MAPPSSSFPSPPLASPPLTSTHSRTSSQPIRRSSVHVTTTTTTAPTSPSSPPTPRPRAALLERIPSSSSVERPYSPHRKLSYNDDPTAPPPPPLDPLNLLRLAPGVVQSRTGSVLSRGFILKSDARPVAPASSSETEGLAFASGEGEAGQGIKKGAGEAGGGGGGKPKDPSLNPPNDGFLHLTGATNFRAASLGVYGVAQPTFAGLQTVLTLLRSNSTTGSRGEVVEGRETVWFCTREEPIVYLGGMPFVLREARDPLRTYAVSDRAENLEGIEKRLKQDILKESARYGGMILVQEEIHPNSLTPSWLSVTPHTVLTPSEIFSSLTSAPHSFNVTYHRTPVTRDQSPEDRYLDTYTTLLSTIPTSSSLVFNCGIGVVRTTFAMSAALVVRRKQVMSADAEGGGGRDPFGLVKRKGAEMEGGGKKAREVLRRSEEEKGRDRSLLGLMSVLQKSLATTNQGTVLTLLSSHPQLLENLRNALIGNYDLILSLLSCLDDGVEQKNVADFIIDHCSALVNLRESVLQHRVRYASLALLNSTSSQDHRSKALAALERYFFLVAFTSFVSTSPPSFPIPFSTWLKGRSEIGKMIGRLRKGRGAWDVFAPVEDLSGIARGERGVEVVGRPRWFGAGAGGEVIGDEWARQIVRNRSGIILRTGMILKNDQWSATTSSTNHEGLGADDSPNPEQLVRGAINFRRVAGSSLYGLSQPTQEGIQRVLELVRKGGEGEGRAVWINLREEPLIYINGTPYVLRQEAVSLRNVKSYAGISSSRLELLEDRLKSDLLSELSSFDGRLLLHTEDEDGSVNPIWETIDSPSCIKTVREMFDETAAQLSSSPSSSSSSSAPSSAAAAFKYYRIPITAEKSPDFSDVRELVEIVAQLDNTEEQGAVIVNCQLGRGRSTRAQVIITLVQRWLRSEGMGLVGSGGKGKRSSRYSYTVINNLLRTIRSGQEVKNAVDEAITACGYTFDLLDSIEDARQEAEDAGDDTELRQRCVARGLQNLRAYYFLILFSSFLNESKAETWRQLRDTLSYEAYVKDRPVFKTIERELDTAGIEALVPLEKPIAAGNALSDEVAEFVAKRSGRILSPFTLLKSDYFSGLQKMSLPERVEGAPNFRRVRLLFGGDAATPTSAAVPTGADGASLVYGTGMPTVDGLRRALEKMGGHEKHIVWTSMREEPVIYVSGGRPHVLRLFDAPLENVVTTGVTTETVEAMEVALKEDLLLEASMNGGKVLLHDEIAEADGSFTVTAIWEEVSVGDILTPREVFAMMRQEGLQVDYERLPVTDEQAPIPGVYTRIEERVSSALRSNPDDTGFVFNCQMGRGRTTTGMVAAALISNILFSPLGISDLSTSILNDNDSLSLTWDGRESDPYLAGEYKIVLQLVGVLQHGKTAKKLADRAIDGCEGVQNLRKAVYDFKLRAEAADIGSAKHSKIFHVACNYLYRYASLIVFANYLLEKSAALETDDEEEEEDGEGGGGKKRMKPFKEWLKDRREIYHILSRKTLE